MKVRKDYKYQLAETISYYVNIYPETDIETDFIRLDRVGGLTIKKGYAFDGPSGPTIDTKSFMRGSLFHDALYQLMREGYLLRTNRKKADKVLRRICIEDGMWKVRAWWVYRAVRIGAAQSAKGAREVHTAP